MMRNTATLSVIWLTLSFLFLLTAPDQGIHWFALVIANVYIAAGFIISARKDEK